MTILHSLIPLLLQTWAGHQYSHLLPMLMVVLVVMAFAGVLAMNRIVMRRIRRRLEQAQSTGDILKQAIKSSGNNVVYFNIQANYIDNLYGHLLPDEGVSVSEWKSHVHPDDLDMTLNWFHQMMDGKLKTADFRYRWNFSYSGGTPRWGYLHNNSTGEYRPGHSRPVGIVSTLVDETRQHQQEEEEQDLTGKYRLIFEQSIIGLSFYDPQGRLLDANRDMRQICHFDSAEGDEFFSKANLFDMPPFHDNVDPNNVEEFWVCTQSVIPERGIHTYLEIRLHPIYDEQGQLVYLAITARDITQERELYLQTKENDERIQKVNEAIQLYETELRYMMQNSAMQAWRVSLDRNCIEFYNGLSTIERTFTLQQLPTIFVSQDDDFVQALSNPAKAFDHPLSYTGLMQPVVTLKKTEPQWVQINSIPEYDEQGRLTGAFGVWRNISNLMQKQEQLKRETERANDSGRLKSVFLANMTHEIRTPLNAIVGFSDLLQSIEAPDDKREMIRIIHNNCDMLLRLINDILVLSNVDANAMQITPEEVDFSHEFDDICQSLAQRVSEPGVEFQKDNPLPSLPVSIDNRRIQQVITNFVTNAVKYTHQGHIRVGYRLEERDGRQGLYVYCEDTGSGIPKDQLSRVFERFVKLNDFIQGTGLGLSICKAIIEKCNGQIGVDSEEGQGSTFWFWIPV